MTPRIPILMYHDIADDGPPETAPYRVSPAAFRQQMRLLRERGYQSIALEEWAECIAAGRAPEGRRVVITFDDGYRTLTRHVLPVLQDAGLAATVFVVTGRVGGVADWDRLSGEPPALMDWDALREWQRHGNAVASHCTLHRELPQLPDAAIADDSREARAALRDALGREVRAIAYPWGKSDERVRRVLAASGYSIGVGVTGGASTLADDLMLLPRIEIFADDDIASFARKVEGDEPDVNTRDNPARFGTQAAPDDAAAEERVVRLDELRALSVRLEHLIAELTQIKAALDRMQEAAAATAAAAVDAKALHPKFIALFNRPPTGPEPQALVPYQEVCPGVRIGFAPEARALLTVAAQPEPDAAPAAYRNSLRLSFAGGSWLSLEASLTAAELADARRFEFSLCAQANRAVSGRLLLRRPQPAPGGDIDLGTIRLGPVAPRCRLAGPFAPLAATGPGNAPGGNLVMIFHTGDAELNLELISLGLSFAGPAAAPG